MTFFSGALVFGLTIVFASVVLKYNLSRKGTPRQRRNTMLFFAAVLLGGALLPAIPYWSANLTSTSLLSGIAILMLFFGLLLLVGLSFSREPTKS